MEKLNLYSIKDNKLAISNVQSSNVCTCSQCSFCVACLIFVPSVALFMGVSLGFYVNGNKSKS